ncbi:helix-turn-helix domain-containing protein [Streptomyces jumonjinensis]|uniref:Helix-turn-helix domain-containing protein n=1 Tax=Streptomyces jumonjinensis TaxID=1945 RepID=A0A646KLS7_STRJU|nr:helix-turn-helix transcriptional regulator [Streptomyces jumonjinensis]MQT02901.1 helix-turn-helix domain-containing protein [Streptomyces jumonjinensis]
MSEPSGPTLRRRNLGGELRRLREAADLDQAAVAHHLECSTSKISRLENGQGLAKVIEIRSMLDLFGVTDPEARSTILEMHKAAGEIGWWEQAEYEQVMPSGLSVYVGLEYDARAVQSWELGFIPGLLQTRDYARAVLAALPNSSDGEITRMVEVRMQRQQRLTSSSPLELWAVIDESVLHRDIGGTAVMASQIRSLVKSTHLPNITIQVFPRKKDVHPGLRGAFSLLEFRPPGRTIGYVDSPAGNVFLEKDRQVQSLRNTFSRLQAGALDPEESNALMRELIS